MTVQTLVVTTGQSDHSLLERMNLQTDALVGNQCGRDEVERFVYRGRQIAWYSFCEQGVGLNRNNLLMRASADVCVLADDDLRFLEGYERHVRRWFARYPRADVLVFNLLEEASGRYVNRKVFRVTARSYGKYGAARLAFRRESVIKKGICFHLLFGGGARYGAGEDSLFLRDCLQKGLYVLAVPDVLAEVLPGRPSSWFSGYHRKFFVDRGALFAALSPRLAWPLALRFALKHYGKYHGQVTLPQALGWMWAGIREMRRRGG